MGKLLGNDALVGGRIISSPLVFSDLALWLDASDMGTLFQDTSATTQVTSDGQSVARWNDKSGNNNYVIQAAATAMPTYWDNVLNGRAALLFDGGDYLDTLQPFNSFPMTVVVVGRTSSTTSVSRGAFSLYHSVTFGSRVNIASTNVVNVRVAPPGAVRGLAVTIAGDTPFVIGGCIDGGNIYALCNGVISAALSHASTVVANIARVGGFNVNSTATLFNGHLMEICMYTRDLTNSELVKLMNYLRVKWVAY